MRFEKNEEKPRRQRKYPPSVVHDVHIAVAVEVADRKDMQLARFEFFLHSVGGEDGDSDAAEDGFLDGLIAAKFEAYPQIPQ
jgi:hypothetical protein